MDRHGARLTAADLDFLVSTVAPQAGNKRGVLRLLREDEDFRDSFLEEEAVFRRVVEDRDVFLKISPVLYFEVLLRRVRRELTGATHTIERGRAHKVAVFDAGRVVDLLANKEVLHYLADMLSSFTRVDSYSISYRLGRGVWGRIRISDADIDCLIRLMDAAGEEYRPHFYKRIADICLFLLGIFPESVSWSPPRMAGAESGPRLASWVGRTAQEYEEQGKKYYRLAAKHPAARDWEMAEVFERLYEDFQTARKPLNLIAEQYIQQRRHAIFDG